MDRSRASYAVLALLVIASAAMTAWIVGARHELRGVEAAVVGTPECSGATVRPHRDADGARDGDWLIGARPGTRCRVTIELTNRSGRDVHLDGLVPPALSGDEASELAVHRLLRDGRTLRVPLDVDVRPVGCGIGGDLTSGRPEVAVSLWHRTEVLPVAGTLYVRGVGGSPCAG